ncbi:MAG: ion transporter [Myxococcota bacterium]|jgi:voltage-gated sodium channel|nr:ion transporter [Myxococcota bacterium]
MSDAAPQPSPATPPHSHRRLPRLIAWLIAERLVVAMILLNTVALFALASRSEGQLGDSVWFYVDWLCVLYFVLEAGLKLRRDGWRGYFASGWNRFDFIVVMLSLPVLLSPWVDLHDFAAVLLLRLGRLFRLFRLLRFIPNASHLATGIQRALKTSFGVFLALALILLILAIGATMLFGELDPEHFGDPLISMYHVFRVFTLEGWYELPDGLVARAGGAQTVAVLARLFFVGCVLGGGLLGISIANAVFVDEMTMDNNNELERRVDGLSAEIKLLRQELQRAAPTSPRRPRRGNRPPWRCRPRSR